MIEDEVNGLLVPAGDVAALAEAMQRLLDDPDLRTRMGHAARGVTDRFTAATVMPEFEQLYRAVAGIHVS
jgi:glycosyltransferase involved in cell wall biosynthesis